MIAVIQRVNQASVSVEALGHKETIKKGLCVFLGVEDGDKRNDAGWIAKKIEKLRIFSDCEGKMNQSVQDITGEILLVSQFTLAGDCSQGNRPSFIKAAKPEIAKPLVEEVGNLLELAGIQVKQGIFGAMMRVEIDNDGPVTIILKQD